jgi:3-oxoacyl-[acyl-carrier-protein] synthase II
MSEGRVPKKDDVVITGMGVVSPVGIGLEAFRDALREGRTGLGPITSFDASQVKSKVAGEVKEFHPLDFMERRFVQRTALFSQYAVAAARMAWRHAGFADGEVPDPQSVSVMIGNGIGGVECDTQAQFALFAKGPNRIPAMTIPKMIANEAAGNISMALGFKGAAHTLLTACASGTDAIGCALDRIRSGRSEIVITGGTEAAVTEYAIGGFCVLKALSTAFNDTPEKSSRPFDKDRDGFVMGEGAGILVIETREHAEKRGAPVLAELAGYGATADAYHLTAPHPEGEGAADAMRLALKDAGMTVEEVDYINAHGTSTPTNDPTETKAIKRALGEHAYRIKVSSTKGMTGHCIGAAGALEAIASVIAIQDGFFPPTLNLDEPDPECDLDYVPNHAQKGKIGAALSSSLGFGGHNAVIALRKP